MAEQADLVLTNATVWTVDDAQPHAEAVAIAGGRIIAVGNTADVMLHKGPDTQVIDLDGAFVLPGFNDNHIHFGSAASFHEFNIMRASTQEEFVARMQAAVDGLQDGEWITGGFWGAYDQWAFGSSGGEQKKPFTPDMKLVEEITKDHPVFIRKFDSSEFAVNERALAAIEIGPADLKNNGIAFVRNDAGEFTGIIRGDRSTIMGLFGSVIPKVSHERRLQQSRQALRLIAEAGVTNVSDMSDWAQLDIFRELHEAGELTTRIHFRPQMEDWPKLEEMGAAIGSGDAWIRLGAVKSHIDGIMGTSSARFFEPYDSDPTTRGGWRKLVVDENGEFAEGQFLAYMLKADAAGLQLSVHAIGDEANHLLLNYLEELIEQNGPKERRFRLVHAQVIAEADFERLGPLDIVAEVQPYHLSDDMRWMEERIGTERCRGAYAFKSIVESGATLSFGTDWPGTSAAEYPISPMLGLYAAVTRQTVTGDPPDGWFPEQRITIEQAIRAYTLNSAYANFEADTKGSIEVGKFADITVLDRNLLEIEPREYLETSVLYTIVNGKIVYEPD
ncbi:MAG: amidohydrolase [Armatimonadetes bacterium]|nr:amidohydrolase [Armatimonadota bacterium]